MAHLVSEKCGTEGCALPSSSRGLCNRHYARQRRYGDVHAGGDIRSHDLRERYALGVIQGSEGECWGWRRKVNNHGYGRVGDLYAHRVSYEIHVGPIPAGLQVLHRCDNPPCSNPSHLFLGTVTDNMRDMWAKGRGVGFVATEGRRAHGRAPSA